MERENYKPFTKNLVNFLDEWIREYKALDFEDQIIMSEMIPLFINAKGEVMIHIGGDYVVSENGDLFTETEEEFVKLDSLDLEALNELRELCKKTMKESKFWLADVIEIEPKEFN